MPNNGTVRDVLVQNVNKYALGLLFLTIGLWVTGYTEYAVYALLALLLLVVAQNLWAAYKGLLQ